MYKTEYIIVIYFKVTKTMLSLIISLFLHCELISCVNYEKINFNEDSLMKQHHQNSFQIKAFIKEAHHRFRDEPPAITAEQNTTRADKTVDFKRTNWWWDNSSFIEQQGLNSAKFLFPHIRSRPSFPFSITPYTTELNYQHLNWDEIFPDSKLRSGSDAPSVLLNHPRVTGSTKDQNDSGTLDQTLNSRTLPFNAISHPKSSLRGLTTTLSTPNEDYMMWLQEITTFTPVEKWLQTLASRTGVTQSYATNSTTPIQHRELKNDSTDQSPRIFRQALRLPHTSAHDEDLRVTVTTTSAQFYLVNVSGIIHLQTVTMKDERRTNDKPVTIADDDSMKRILTTAADEIHIGQHPKTPESSSRRSRRFQSNARKRKRYHHQRKKLRQKHRHRHLKFRDYRNYQTRDVEYPMLRRRRRTIGVQRRFSLNTPRLKGERKQKTRGLSHPGTRPCENAKHSDPTYLPTPTSKFLSKLDDTEHERHIKLIKELYRLRYNKTVQKDKQLINHQVKESSRRKIKKKDRRSRNDKTELIRKIMEGSSYSYSEEEAILRKNFIGALRYGNRT